MNKTELNKLPSRPICRHCRELITEHCPECDACGDSHGLDCTVELIERVAYRIAGVDDNG